LPGGCHFDAHAAGTDNGKPRRHVAAVSGLAVGPRPCLGDAGQVGERGPASGADRNRMPRGQHRTLAAERGDGDSPRTGQPPMAAHQVGADSAHPVGLAAVVPIAHVAVAPAEDARGADRTGDRLARAVDPAGIRDGNDRAQQRFAGHTGPIGTLASDEFALDDRYAEARGPGALCGILPNWPGAEHHDVVVLFHGCCHGRRSFQYYT
jgi:hypothetical protein